MRNTTDFFLLLPRKIIHSSFDSIADAPKWRWFITVDKVTNTFSDTKGSSYWLKNAVER